MIRGGLKATPFYLYQKNAFRYLLSLLVSLDFPLTHFTTC